MITIEQIKANRAKWIKALKSGGYNQTNLVLQNNVGFCCLGVAYDVLNGEWQGDIELDGYLCTIPERRFNSLPAETAQQLGLSMEDLNLLMDLNDNHHCSFKAIARVIQSLPITIEEIENDLE